MSTGQMQNAISYSPISDLLSWIIVQRCPLMVSQIRELLHALCIAIRLACEGKKNNSWAIIHRKDE